MPNEIAVIDPQGSTAVAPREQVGGLLRPVAAPSEVLAAQNDTRKLVSEALQKGRDYGPIPGAGDKPVLLKPGGERICAAFGCAPRYRIISQEIDHDREVEWTKRKKKWKNRRPDGWETTSGVSRGLYRYVVECELEHRGSGAIIGQGIASASTMESKYIDRPRDGENTVLKMASKRAFIAATLNAFGLSDQFTQDVEDMQPEDEAGPAASQPDPERATSGQVDEIRTLLRAEVITDAERDQVNGLLSKGISAKRAESNISGLKKAINERMEKQGVAEQPKEHRNLTNAKKLYRDRLNEFRVDLVYDEVALAKFEEEAIGRTSSEDWLASEYLRAAEAVAQSEAPETESNEAA